MKKWTVLKVGLVSAIMITTPVSAAYQPVQSRTSSDRYTDYIKDYVGTNLASFGYTALDGKRRDQYGNGIVEIIFETDSGVYIDPEDEEQLKKYVVVDQSIDPDTEIKMEYEKQENGEEYDNLLDFISCDEILLKVREIDGNAIEKEESLTKIKTAPDKHTEYIRDYVGRNLADCGYISLGGELRDAYGVGSIQVIPVSNDGSFIDVEDKEILKNYVVTSQSTEPNTEIKFTLLKDDNGQEYSNLVDTQSCSDIQVRVSKVETK